jgi:hypothetical protein
MDVLDQFFDDLAEEAASPEILRSKRHCGMSECMRRLEAAKQRR